MIVKSNHGQLYRYPFLQLMKTASIISFLLAVPTISAATASSATASSASASSATASSAAASSAKSETLPPLHEWANCDKFKDPKTHTEYNEAVHLNTLIMRAMRNYGLPYRIAMVRLARDCKFATTAATNDEENLKTIFLSELGDAFNAGHEESISDWVERILRAMGLQGDMSETAGRIIEGLRGSRSKEYVITRGIEAAKVFADREYKLAIEYLKTDGNDSSGIEGSSGFSESAALVTPYSPANPSSQMDENEHPMSANATVQMLVTSAETPDPGNGALQPALKSLDSVDSFSSSVDASAWAEADQFDFTPNDSNYCTELEDMTARADFVQQILESYGLGYAFLFAHRLDQCDTTSTLVKELHNDLYRWLSSQDLKRDQVQSICKKLKLPVPVARSPGWFKDGDPLAYHSTIELAHKLAKWSIEQINF